MGDNDNSTLLTVVIIVIAALIVLWLLWSLDHHADHHDNCYAPKPDPVGGIKCENLGPGEVKISWDPTPNATHYRVYINACPIEPQAVAARKKCMAEGRHKVGQCDNCCPADCNACVSQSNYAKLIETDDTSIIVETCEPCICYIVVPYNRCGQAGDCKTVNFCDVECIVDAINAWIVSNDCNGTKIAWDCPRCCDTVHIYVDGQLEESVDANLLMYTLPEVPEGIEISIQCESSCGLGELNILVPGAVMNGGPQSRRRGARGRKGRPRRARNIQGGRNRNLNSRRAIRDPRRKGRRANEPKRYTMSARGGTRHRNKPTTRRR